MDMLDIFAEGGKWIDASFEIMRTCSGYTCALQGNHYSVLSHTANIKKANETKLFEEPR